MKNLFRLDNALEALAVLVSLAALAGVLQSFVVGRHFVIPTLFLVLAVLFGNLVRFGVRGHRWAKHFLFWTFLVLACHAFFALFWAAEARPGLLFGAAFYPLYGGFFIVVGALCALYAGRNSLFSR